MKNIDFRKFLPHGVGLVLFILISIIYFHPVLEGYKLNQGDIEKHKAVSHEIKSHKEQFGENALWSGNIFAGMPTYLTTKVRYDGNITEYFLAIAKGGLPHPASALFAYLIGFFILLLCLRVNPWLAIVGAIAFAFSSYFLIIIEAGHNSKVYAIAFMAPLLGGFIEALRGRVGVGALLIAIFTAIQLFVNHLQITYYLFFILLFVGVAELIHAIKAGLLKPFFKRVGIIVLAALLGVLPNIGNLLITYEYSKQSTRGKTDLTIEPNGKTNEKTVSSGLDKDYITQWSYGIDETFTLIVPNAKGGSSIPILGDTKEVERLREEDPQFFNVVVNEYQNKQNAILSYFGNQPIVSGPVYIGIIIVALALLALLFVRTRFTIALALVTILTIALSWGKNFMPLTEFFIDYIPGYNKFRAVAMILFVAEFTAPILAILFLDKLIKDREEILTQKKKLFIGIGFIGMVVLFMALSPSSFVELSSTSEIAKFSQSNTTSAAYTLQDQIEDYRSGIVSDSAWRSLMYLLGGSLVLLLFLFGKIKKEILIVGLGTLILVDLWSIDKIYLNNEKAEGRTASGTKYVSWLKPVKQQIPYEPSVVDRAIMQNEINQKPSITKSIQLRVQDAKNKKGGRLDNREVYGLQYAELMSQTHYRVLNSNARLDQDVRTPYFHKTLGGYHGAKMKKYQELVDFYLGIEHYQVRQAFSQAGKSYVERMLPSLKISNMLNVKYLIGPDNTGQSAESLVLNPYAYGNAWFVERVVEVENADSAILSLADYDLKKAAILEKSDLQNITTEGSLKKSYALSASDFIKLTDYDPNKLTYEYSAGSTQFVVFSEIFYKPGWKVYVNGDESNFTKVNYLLRGMELEAGGGTIEFVFDPVTVNIGEKLTWISSLIILLLLIGVIYKGIKKGKLGKASSN